VNLYFFGLMFATLLLAIVASVSMLTNKDELGRAKIKCLLALVVAIFVNFLWAVTPKRMPFGAMGIDQTLVSSPKLLEQYLYETHKTLERTLEVLDLTMTCLALSSIAFFSYKFGLYWTLRKERKAKEKLND
jgi:uncharacterized membrane protein YkgB